MNENYLQEFERWTAGPKKRRDALSAEFAEHLSEAEAAGELGSTMDRLGPPRDAAKAFAAGHELRPAPLPRRIAAALIDMGIPVLTLVAMVVIGTAWGIHESVAGVTALLAAMWWVVGLTIMEWRFGRGPGKAALGLRVVSEEGIAPSFGQVVVRRLTLVFSGPLQLIDWAFALFDPRRQRAVEKIAHTIVVQDEVPEPRSTAAAGVLA